ncbi:hypothetical protein FSP39_011911 [Pinctada imbricata]|uniref:Uncharacterized protein n=1 Tax=Pinctada imbricata TaxID=66713 RepID=A0AA88YC31_PINIB|nr:hypothetical protein FSP39_011911 [Pinctada imbricata]
MSISQLQSTAPHVQCADSCRSYCILSCMAEKHSEHSGAVSSDCVCDPGQTTDAGTGIPSWCFYTQGECDFFSTCLQSRHTNCTMETNGLTTQCNWLTGALNDFSNCSTKEWLRKVRFCFQAYFISSLDIEANTTCSELTDMMNYESYDQCLRLTTADNGDFCDLDDDDKAKIRSSFISTFSDELQRNIDPTLCWMDC